MKSTMTKGLIFSALLISTFVLGGCMPTPISLEQNSPVIEVNKAEVYPQDPDANLSVGHVLQAAKTSPESVKD